MAKFWRQGDVIFERVEALPNWDMERLAKAPAGVLAVGGETGHLHRIEGAHVVAVAELLDEERHTKAWTIDENGEALIELERETPIEHEEHATLLLPTGTFRVRHVGLPRARMAD